MYYFLLLSIVIVCIYVVVRDRTEYIEFKKTKSTKKRIAFYRGWLIKSYLLVGLPGIIVLILLGKTNYLINPIYSNESFRLFQSEISKQSVLTTIGGVVIGMVVGVILMGFVTFMKTRWNNGISTSTIGDVQSLLPRNAHERRYGMLLAIGAGINEEILFRVAVPALLIGILHEPQVAIVVSILAFGLMHIYQGAIGVFGAMFAGAMLMSLYLLTGSIFFSMLIHAFIDMNTLVIQPFIASSSLRITKAKTHN
jgi:membrane protease YdiL (CAAX protease family)